MAGIMRALAGSEDALPVRALKVAQRLPQAVRMYPGHLAERWDGKGQPARLRAEEIPLPLRIVHVARDATFQHLLGGAEFAAGVIRQRAGGAFDPAIAALFANEAADILALDEERPAWDEVLAAEPGPG